VSAAALSTAGGVSFKGEWRKKRERKRKRKKKKY
jgi:hypothetical protein